MTGNDFFLYLSKSADGGETWTDTLVTSGSWASGSLLAVSAQDPQTVYILASMMPGYILSRSTDGGQSWSTTHFGEGSSTSFLAADPTHPGRLFGGLAYDGLARSDDGGQTWARVLDTDVWTLRFNPSSPGEVFVASSYITPGVWFSWDGGLSWGLVGTGLQPVPFSQVLSLDIGPSGDTLFVGTDGGGAWAVDLTVPGDLDLSGRIDVLDLVIHDLMTSGRVPVGRRADVNGDGSVTPADRDALQSKLTK